MIAAGGADDPNVLGHLARLIPAKERRNNFAACKVAGAAKNHQIKRIDRNDTRNHKNLQGGGGVYPGLRS